MPATAQFSPRFRRALERKKRQPALHRAVKATVDQLMEDRRHPGLNAHLLDRQARIWEAYGSLSVRVTYELDGDHFIFRNNCRHDIIDRGQW